MSSSGDPMSPIPVTRPSLVRTWWPLGPTMDGRGDSGWTAVLRSVVLPMTYEVSEAEDRAQFVNYRVPRSDWVTNIATAGASAMPIAGSDPRYSAPARAKMSPSSLSNHMPCPDGTPKSPTAREISSAGGLESSELSAELDGSATCQDDPISGPVGSSDECRQPVSRHRTPGFPEGPTD